MKILYISSSIIPSGTANSIQVMKMCEAFAKNGHEVTLLSPARNSEWMEDPFQFYGVRNNFKIVRFHGFFTPPQSEIRLNLYGIFCCLLALRIRPDIVYGRNAHGLFYCSLLGFRFIYELHYVPKPSFKTRLILKSRRLEYLVVVTESIRKKLRDLVSARIIVACNGANLLTDNSHIGESHKKIKRDQSKKIGYLGNLYPGKGSELVLELSKKMPTITFQIIGGFEKDIENVKRKALPNVMIHGFFPPSEIPGLLGAFDILLLTPLRNSSGYRNDENISEVMSPLKMFEYMSAGKAILASDIPVLREVLKHNKNAILVPPEDIDKWEEELIHLMHDDKLRSQLGSRARQDVLQLYTWPKRAKKVLNPLE